MRGVRTLLAGRSGLAAALAIALVFVLIASRDITNPGLYPDEVRHVLPALAFAEGDPPTNAVGRAGPAISVGHHKITAMVAPYVGSLKAVAFAPVAAVVDVTPRSIRYFSIAMGALVLLATFAFTRRLFRSDAVGLVAIALLAVGPGFIFYSRHDYDSTVFMLLATTVCGWQLLRWWDTGSAISLVLGMLALGLGLYDKANFIWVVLALPIALAVVAGREVLARLSWRTAIMGAGAFVVGTLPLIVYNLRSGLGTIRRYGELSSETATPQEVPLDERIEPTGSLFSQLTQRVRVLGDLIDGSGPSRMVDSSFPSHFEVVPLLVAAAAVAIVVQVVVRRPLSRDLRAAAFALLAGFLILCLAAATGEGFHGHHLMLVYPFPQIVLAFGIVQVGRWLGGRVPAGRRKLAVPLAIAACAAVPITFNAVTTAGMFDSFAKTGGNHLWSDGIYRLQSLVTREHDDKPVFALDWGIAPLLVSLSQGKVPAEERWFDMEIAKTRARQRAVMAKAVRDPRTWYVLHSPDTTLMVGARKRFFTVARDLNRRPTTVGTVTDRADRPVFQIYSLRPLQGRASAQRPDAARSPRQPRDSGAPTRAGLAFPRAAEHRRSSGSS